MEEIIQVAEVDTKLLAFVYVQRYGGLRVSDAAILSAESLDAENRLFLRMEKTGEPVRVPLPQYVGDALRAVPRSKQFYFWSGTSKVASVAGIWAKRLAKLFKKAGIRAGHPHRFRDTFAVELLQGGVSIEDVSRLLGHSSIRVTERHYSPWVKSRQEREVYRVNVQGVEF